MLHTQYKIRRNQSVVIMRKSIKLHYQTYFEENAKEIRKTWSGVKNIINFRTMTKEQATSMIIENKLKTDPTNIAEGFNNYFSLIAEKLQQNLTFGNVNFSKYLNEPSYFISWFCFVSKFDFNIFIFERYFRQIIRHSIFLNLRTVDVPQIFRIVSQSTPW